MLIRLFPHLFNNRFLLYAMQSPSFRARMLDAAIGMTVKHLRVGGVEGLMVPVPPKAEQDHLVTLVAELFKLCDDLSRRLASKLTAANHMARFMTAAITGVTAEAEEDESMTPPRTELIAPLLLRQSPKSTGQAPLASILAANKGELAAKDLWHRFGGEIDAFYAQLKTEIAQGWIREPEVAQMREMRETA